MKKVRVGVVGCGAISPAYLRNMKTHFSAVLEVVACADLDRELAAKRATEFGVARVCSTDELLAAPDIELAVNLTPFTAHYDVSMAILKAGKHLFTEKSLAQTREEGMEILQTAKTQRTADRRGGRHISFRRPAGLPAGHQRRRNRQAHRRQRLHRRGRTPRALPQGVRRRALRHGALLSDGPCRAPGTGGPRERLGAEAVRGTDRRQGRQNLPRESPHDDRRSSGLRRRLRRRLHRLRRRVVLSARASRSTATRPRCSWATRTAIAPLPG